MLWRFPKFNRGLDVVAVFLRQPGWGVFGHATPRRIPDKGYITARFCGSGRSSAKSGQRPQLRQLRLVISSVRPLMS